MGHKKGFKTDKKRLKQLSHWKLTGAGGDGNETVFDPFSSILLPFVTFCCIFELVLFSLFLSSVFFFLGFPFSPECFDQSIFESSCFLGKSTQWGSGGVTKMICSISTTLY